MKLLTLNTHSIIEENSEKKALYFADTICETKPDVVALQEVSQSSECDVADDTMRGNVLSLNEKIPVRTDNYLAKISSRLLALNTPYHAIWLPVKRGFKTLDEGVAILTKLPITRTDVLLLSRTDEYLSWKTRKALGVKLSEDIWFYSLHFGWWSDSSDPFNEQWCKFCDAVKGKRVWAMGDFNSPDSITDEGYDLVTSTGWRDSYRFAKKRDEGITAIGSIAGWQDTDKRRIDYIFSNFDANIESSTVIFNGRFKKVISDHYGVLIDIK